MKLSRFYLILFFSLFLSDKTNGQIIHIKPFYEFTGELEEIFILNQSNQLLVQNKLVKKRTKDTFVIEDSVLFCSSSLWEKGIYDSKKIIRYYYANGRLSLISIKQLERLDSMGNCKDSTITSIDIRVNERNLVDSFVVKKRYFGELYNSPQHYFGSKRVGHLVFYTKKTVTITTDYDIVKDQPEFNDSINFTISNGRNLIYRKYKRYRSLNTDYYFEEKKSNYRNRRNINKIYDSTHAMTVDFYNNGIIWFVKTDYSLGSGYYSIGKPYFKKKSINRNLYVVQSTLEKYPMSELYYYLNDKKWVQRIEVYIENRRLSEIHKIQYLWK